MNVARPTLVMVIGFGLAALGLVGCAAAVATPPTASTSLPATQQTDPATARPSGHLTAAQAHEAVRRLVPTGDLTVTGPDSLGSRSLYAVDGQGVHAMVDALTGSLASVLLSDRMPSTPGVTITEATARSDSLAFLTASGFATDGLTATVELIDHGEFKEYHVAWQRRINGALVPDQRLVSVNPQTGEVFSLVNVSTPYAPPPVPALSLDQAVVAAKQLLGESSTTVESSDLVVTFASDGKQLLVWQVGIHVKGSNPGAAMVQVDAMSGAAIVIGRG